MPNSSLTAIKGIEQGRANFAYEKALEAKSKLKENGKKYKAYVKKLPMLIKTNGLGASLAFVKSKESEEAYGLIYQNLTEWLKSDEKKLINIEDDLVKTVISLNSAEYRAVTNEVLAFLNWLRRFADGLIEGEPDE